MTLGEYKAMIDFLIDIDLKNMKALNVFINDCMKIGAFNTFEYICGQWDLEKEIDRGTVGYKLQRDLQGI